MCLLVLSDKCIKVSHSSWSEVCCRANLHVAGACRRYSMPRGVSDACAVCKNIAYYRMRMGIIGDQFAHSVTNDLNIYYKQLPCVGTPKFQFHIDRISLKWKLVLFTSLRPSWRAFICTRHKHRKPPLLNTILNESHGSRLVNWYGTKQR